MKEKVKEKKIRIWEMKCREIDSIVEGSQSIDMIFINLEKTYNSIKNRMWRTLREHNIDNGLIGIIKELYVTIRRI